MDRPGVWESPKLNSELPGISKFVHICGKEEESQREPHTDKLKAS